jgi:serine/threonine protein kinase
MLGPFALRFAMNFLWEGLVFWSLHSPSSDFGISRALGLKANLAATQAIGTPGYIAPEVTMSGQGKGGTEPLWNILDAIDCNQILMLNCTRATTDSHGSIAPPLFLWKVCCHRQGPQVPPLVCVSCKRCVCVWWPRPSFVFFLSFFFHLSKCWHQNVFFVSQGKAYPTVHVPPCPALGFLSPTGWQRFWRLFD